MTYDRTREYYQIQYPILARPRLLVEGRTYEVLDLSEHGVRFMADEGELLEPGAEVHGAIKFREETVLVRGSVIRVNERQVAAFLEIGVPFKTIIDEQRYLLEHHPGMAW